MKANELLKQFLLEKGREEINYYSDEEVIINTFKEVVQYYKDINAEDDFISLTDQLPIHSEFLNHSEVLQVFEIGNKLVAIIERSYEAAWDSETLFEWLLESIENAYFVKPVTKITYEPE